jgi:oligopeptidase B
MIPISLMYKVSLKNVSGGNPLLLYGYGCYGNRNTLCSVLTAIAGAIIQPTFSAEILSLVDRGFIYAIAHVRGDLTMGWDWYEMGKFLHKKNTFTDFIAAAEYLIQVVIYSTTVELLLRGVESCGNIEQEEYTTPEKLAIYGKSAGGMLVCAAANMRPDLFKAVIADVPYVDVFATICDAKEPVSYFL